MNEISKTFMKTIKRKNLLLFVGFLILVFTVTTWYNFSEWGIMRMQGVHQWRQSVGASLALNYYQDGMKFNEPSIHNNLSYDGFSDISVIEFPFLYYTVAILYNIFGPHEMVFRLFNFTLLVTGLIFLMYLIYKITRDIFWSLYIPLVVLMSPMVFYYGAGFMPNPASMAMVFIAWFFIYKFIEKRESKFLYIVSFIFLLAGLTKVTSLLSLMALGATLVVFYIIDWNKWNREYPLKKLIIPAILPFIGVVLWYAYVDFYANRYGGNISAVEVRPIWGLDSETIKATWKAITKRWLPGYIYPYHLALAALFFLFSLFIYKRMKFLVTLLIFIFLGGLSFFFLFYKSLWHHDYYLINILAVVILSYLVFAIWFKSNIKSKILEIVLKAALIGIIPAALISGFKDIDNRVYGFYNDHHRKYYSGLTDIEPYLDSLGVTYDKKVISIPDHSVNISLYLMNRKGFTDFGYPYLSQDDNDMDFYMARGAEYLVVTDTSILEERKYLKPYTKELIGQHKNVFIYNLNKDVLNNNE